MFSFDSIQQSIIDSDVKTSKAWLFKVTTNSGDIHRWSTKDYEWDDVDEWRTFVSNSFHNSDDDSWANLSESYSFKILPESFNGIDLERDKLELGVMAPKNLSFTIVNSGNVLGPADLDNAKVEVQAIAGNGTVKGKLLAFKYIVPEGRCLKSYQKLHVEAESFIQEYLDGTYPNEGEINDVFPSLDIPQDDNVCPPVPFGTAYVPLRSVYVNSASILSSSSVSVTASSKAERCSFNSPGLFGGFATGWPIHVQSFANSENNGSFQPMTVTTSKIEVEFDKGLVTEAVGNNVTFRQGSRFFILGVTSYTYEATKIRSPRELGKKIEWSADSYTLSQDVVTDRFGDEWRGFKAYIQDPNNVGSATHPGGYYKLGDYVLDVPTELKRSDTRSMTDPSDVTKKVLEDFGVPSVDIDSSSGSDMYFASHSYYGPLGIAFNGAFWYKQDRAMVLREIALQCHSRFRITDKIGLRFLRKTSVKSVGASEIMKLRPVGEGTYSVKKLKKQVNDSGKVAYSPEGESQDQFVNISVGGKGTRTKISQEVLPVRFIRNSVAVQKIGQLHYFREFFQDSEESFLLKGTCFGLEPDDVMTVSSHQNYGGAGHDVLIDRVRYNPDLSLAVTTIKFSDDIDDWEDLSPAAIDVPTDSGIQVWEPPIAGPLSDQDVGKAAFDVWGVPYLIVGPYKNTGQFQSIQEAVNRLADSRHNGIYLLNGTYTLTDKIYLPDRSIEVVGESRGGVIITPSEGDEVFYLDERTEKYRFSDFTILSANSSTYSDGMVTAYALGTSSTCILTIERVDFTLADDGTAGSTGFGDRGINVTRFNGVLTVRDCKFDDGQYGLYNHIGVGARILFDDNVFDEVKYRNIYSYQSDQVYCKDNLIKNMVSEGMFVDAGEVLIKGNRLFAKSSGCDGEIYGLRVSTSDAQIIANFIEVITSGNHSIYCAHLGGSRFQVLGNEILVNVTSTLFTFGISTPTSISDSIITNKIKIDNDDVSQPNYGMYLDGSSDGNNVIGNHIDLVNNDANDIGILLSTTADNNLVTGNVTKNVGTAVVNSGSGNTLADNKDI